MNIFEWISEERIQYAIIDGYFSNLQGQGIPLQGITDKQTPAEIHITHRILKNNGFLVPWVDLQQEIRADLTSACSFLARSYQGGNEAELKRKILKQVGEIVKKINRLTMIFNHMFPQTGIQYLPVCMEKEISDFHKTHMNDNSDIEGILE